MPGYKAIQNFTGKVNESQYIQLTMVDATVAMPAVGFNTFQGEGNSMQIRWMAAYLGLALVPVLTSGSFEAAAQSACSPRSDVLGHLAKKYGEATVATGVTNKGGLVEVLTTGDGNTWTIIVSMPNGTSCMVAAGEGWRTMEYNDTKLAPAT